MALQTPSTPFQWTFRRAMGATLVLVLVALSFWLLYRFNQVVFILFAAIVMGTVIRPVVTWLNRRGLPRMAGVILVYFVLLALLIGFVLLLFPLVVEQSATIAAAVPGYYQGLRDWMVNNPNQLILSFSEFLTAKSGAGTANGRADAGLCRSSAGLRGNCGQSRLYCHSYSASSPALDARWAAHHPILVAAGSGKPARGR
jgi:hypothetical protein